MAQGAPIGNQFWRLRAKHGRDKLFATPELLWEAACEYFEWCHKNPWNRVDFKGKDATSVLIPTERPLTMSGLCLYLGCNEAYFRVFKSQQTKDEKDFNTVIDQIEQTISTQQIEGASVGAYNANIISRLVGLTDKKEIDHKGLPDKNITQVEIIRTKREDTRS